MLSASAGGGAGADRGGRSLRRACSRSLSQLDFGWCLLFQKKSPLYFSSSLLPLFVTLYFLRIFVTSSTSLIHSAGCFHLASIFLLSHAAAAPACPLSSTPSIYSLSLLSYSIVFIRPPPPPLRRSASYSTSRPFTSTCLIHLSWLMSTVASIAPAPAPAARRFIFQPANFHAPDVAAQADLNAKFENRSSLLRPQAICSGRFQRRLRRVKLHRPTPTDRSSAWPAHPSPIHTRGTRRISRSHP